MSLLKRIANALPEPGRLSSWPAAMMDRVYLNAPRKWWQNGWSFIKLRVIYLTLFLPLAGIDLWTAAFLAAVSFVRTLFTVDKKQEKPLQDVKKYATIFSKNLLALLFFPIGLISTRIVTFYFTPEKSYKRGVTAGGNYYRAVNAKLKEPENVEALQVLVLKAAHEGHKVMPVGAGRSQGRQFLTEGGRKAYVVDLRKLNKIEIDSKNKTVTVGAGARWIDIQKEANKHALALKVMQASNVFSVGGSVGTNIHGWDHKSGMLSNTIRSIDIVNAKGETQTLTPNDELFHYVTGGLGLFGIVTSVTLELRDNKLLTEKSTEVSIEEYVEYFGKEVQDNEEHELHLFRLSIAPNNLVGSGIAVSYVKEPDAAPCETPNLESESYDGTRADQVLINLARHIDRVRQYYWETETKRLLANNSKPMTTNAVMQPPINAMFNASVSEAEWLQEYFLPGAQLAAFLTTLKKILTDNKVVLLNASVRFVKQNASPALSYAADGDKFAVVLCFNQSLNDDEIMKARKWLRLAQEESIKLGGTYYLPYQQVSSPEQFRRAYPRAQAAQAFKEQVDPQHIFMSGFEQKYMASENGKPNYFKEIMKDEATKTKFSGFLRKVLQRVDVEPFYTLLADILTYCDSHAEIYQELCRRLSEVMPSALGSLSRILSSLKDIKSDLAAQAKALLGDTKTINGLVEIGYPGRFVKGFQEAFEVTGTIAAVYEAPSITDFIQTGIPRPYDTYAKLDYNKPNLASLKDNSADVITCYVGLHHFPAEELDTFLKDVRRVLHDGGKFLLVDHDVIDADTMNMAHMAHMVFNAVTGVSVEEELSERRDFQPMSYWIAKLQEHGLGYAVTGPDLPMVRDEDPSRNRMVSFVKPLPKPVLVPLAPQPAADAEEAAEAWKLRRRPSATNLSTASAALPIHNGSSTQKEPGVSPRSTYLSAHRL